MEKSIEEMDISMESDLTETAFHEAGHAVTAYRFGHYVGKTSIVQEGGRLGLSYAEGPWADGTKDIEYIIALYAGYEAQRKYNGNADITGSSDDNEKAAYYLQFHTGESETSLRQKAREMISNNWHILQAIVPKLVQEKEIDGDDMGFIIDAIDEGGNWESALDRYRALKTFQI
jgi:hypothetical protein